MNNYEKLMENLSIEKLLGKESVVRKELCLSLNNYQSCDINKFDSVFGTRLATTALDINLNQSNETNEKSLTNINICKESADIQEDIFYSSVQEAHLNPHHNGSPNLIQSYISKEENTPLNLGCKSEASNVGNLQNESEFVDESFVHLNELEKPLIDTSEKFNLCESLLDEELLHTQTLDDNNVSFLD